MSSKFALIIANTEYTDPGLSRLSAPGKDAKALGRVLDSPEIGAFDDVITLVNESTSKVGEAIDYFFSLKKPDDLLVLYFSGHGVRDEYGSLYLAVKNTNRARLRSTAIKSDFIREAMDQSRSKRQVLILDCCNSGAFAQGTKAATGVSIGTASAFEGTGYGRVVLTASDATQFAWEGDQVIGETENSLFTRFLVKGLEGEADNDGDGKITVDELYDYVYEQIVKITPKQTPGKWSYKQQGEIVLRQSTRIEDIKPVPLPTPLLDSIENPFADIRLGAVQQLTKLLNGKNLGLARSAREALERVAKEDDSRQVSNAAAKALESIRQAEQLGTQKADQERKTIEETTAQSLAAQKNESEQLTINNVREERSALEISNATRPQSWNAISWFTLGWAIGGLIGGFLYSEFSDIAGGAIGGATGGLVTSTFLRIENVRSNQKNTFRITLAWAIAGAIGWFIGWGLLSEAIGAGIGMAIFAIIGLAGTLGMDYVLSNWKSMAGIMLAWAIGSAIGWSISKGLIEGLSADKASSWAIGMAIGWSIGGFVMGWQILKDINDRANESNEKVTNSSKPSQIKLTETQKVFLLSPMGRSLLGVTVGIILGIIYGINYGRINGITYDFAYAYLSLSLDVPHIVLLITCGLAGLTIYPHKVSIVLLIIGFFVAGLREGFFLYDFIAFGGIFGLPAGALISRILYWLKIIE